MEKIIKWVISAIVTLIIYLICILEFKQNPSFIELMILCFVVSKAFKDSI